MDGEDGEQGGEASSMGNGLGAVESRGFTWTPPSRTVRERGRRTRRGKGRGDSCQTRVLSDVGTIKLDYSPSDLGPSFLRSTKPTKGVRRQPDCYDF
jgi:hypothetical protein